MGFLYAMQTCDGRGERKSIGFRVLATQEEWERNILEARDTRVARARRALE